MNFRQNCRRRLFWNDNKCLGFAGGGFFQPAEVHGRNAEVGRDHVLRCAVVYVGKYIVNGVIALLGAAGVEVFNADDAFVDEENFAGYQAGLAQYVQSFERLDGALCKEGFHFLTRYGDHLPHGVLEKFHTCCHGRFFLLPGVVCNAKHFQ